MTTNPPAGWYADPHDASGLRYWDGASWTSHTHRTDAAPAESAPNDATAAPAAVPVVADPTAHSEQPPVQPSADGAAFGSQYAAPGAVPAQSFGSYEPGTPPVGSEPKQGMGKGARIGIIAAIVVFLILVGGGIVLALSLSSDDGASAPEAATGAPTIPSGWEIVESPSGAITYAHPTDFTDGGEFIDLEQLDTRLSASLPGTSSEVSGMWVDVSNTLTAGSTIMLMTTSGAVDSGNLDAELEAFAKASTVGADGMELGATRTFTTAVGYSATSLEYTATAYEIDSFATVIAVPNGDTTSFVFATATLDGASSAQLANDVANSLVINHAP